jgi:hypothetical protein
MFHITSIYLFLGRDTSMNKNKLALAVVWIFIVSLTGISIYSSSKPAPVVTFPENSIVLKNEYISRISDYLKSPKSGKIMTITSIEIYPDNTSWKVIASVKDEGNYTLYIDESKHSSVPDVKIVANF